MDEMKKCSKCGEQKKLIKQNFEWRNDNNKSTWTWNLDHIIPHSTFKYEDMECEEFQECWALSNLRPYSAKQNILDGVNKTRHKEQS